ncbi:hypothetical protein ACI797_11645 [Geodermatophilus sp. SYSU D00691]
MGEFVVEQLELAQPRVVRVSVPPKVLGDLDAIQRVQADVLGQLGCQACCSGFDIRFDLVRQFVVDEQLNVRGPISG